MSSQPFLSIHSGHLTATELAVLVTVLHMHHNGSQNTKTDPAASRAPRTRRAGNPRSWRDRPRR
ncbi:acyl-CoA carboxylase epsilon subunit [Nocardia sp. 004]|uniref:acyl-CoA carboxylase epsilon subunit n=1 Tax=Nocardia sp. 004 TaxID=3385978 RepID=UPI0039A3080B